MIGSCSRTFEGQQNCGATHSGQGDQIMLAIIIPGHMKLDFFVIVVIMIATMDDSSFIGMHKL